MTLKKSGIAILFIIAGVSAAHADTPSSLIAGYTAEATRVTPGFAPLAARGQEFYMRKWSVSKTMPSCATCHTNQPTAEGKHVVTSKRIAPLSPVANPERFANSAKVEKWFRRNCQEVVGRECSAAEKADFIQFLSK